MQAAEASAAVMTEMPENVQAGKKAKKTSFTTIRNGIFWSSKNISYSVTNTLFTSYISFYATDVLGMKMSTIGLVLLITKLFDGITDLIAGFIVDNTNTRFGKARPYDWCIPLVAIFTTLTFSAPHAPEAIQALYIGVMYVLALAVFGTLLGASDNVYLLRAFPEEQERTNVFGIATAFGRFVNLVIGVLVPMWVAAAGKDHSAWTRTILLATVPIAIISMVRFFTIKEKTVEQPVKSAARKKQNSVSLGEGFAAILKNKYILILTLAIFMIVIAGGLLNTSAAYYFTYFVGSLEKMSSIAFASFASLIMIVLFTPLANRFGKANVMKAALVIALIGNIIRWVGGANMITIMIGLALMMIGIMPISVFFPLFLFDIIDYSEWKTGTRVEGVLAVFPNFANKVAGGLSVSVGAFIMGAAGYDGTLAVQSESAMRAIDMSFNGFPTIILGAICIIMILFFDLDKIMPKVKADLKARKEQAAGADAK